MWVGDRENLMVGFGLMPCVTTIQTTRVESILTIDIVAHWPSKGPRERSVILQSRKTVHHLTNQKECLRKPN